jgi:hypothetical protein
MITGTSLPLLFASIFAPLGALDIVWFHLWKFRLYDQPSARFETLTHLARGALYAAGALILTHYRPLGMWFWVTVALFAVDFINTLFDVISEQKSREPLGGLPHWEYVIHILGTTVEGGVALAFVATSWGNAAALTALAPATDVPPWLALLGTAGAVGAVGFTLFEGTLYVRSIMRTGWAPRPVTA